MSIANKLKTIAENEQKVYNAGKNEQWNDFWDGLQENGNRTQYPQTFSLGWDDKAFNPKYNFVITEAIGMFRNTKITQLAKKLKDNNLTFDTSQLNGASATQMFQVAKVEDVPTLDLRNVTSLSHLFSYSNVTTIERLILGNKLTSGDSAFIEARKLKHCIFDGVLSYNGLNLKYCPLLDKESITSLINILSTTTSGLSVTLSLTAVNKAFETSEGANDGSTSTEWTTLIGTKSNWTISLA